MCPGIIPYRTIRQYFVGKLGLTLVDGSEDASLIFPTSVDGSEYEFPTSVLYGNSLKWRPWDRSSAQGKESEMGPSVFRKCPGGYYQKP